MKRVIFYFLLFNIVTFQSASAFTFTDSSGILSFSGKVTDAKTGEPLVGASVYFSDLKTGATTNKDGLFSISNIPQGRHLVEISFIGYATLTEYVDLFQDIRKDFSLSTTVIENREVVVTGVSAATQQRRAVTPITVVKRQDIIKVTATNLIDALSKKPGISQISTGPAVSKPVIRGLGYNRVVVLNDGARQEGQQWGDEHGIEIDEYSVQKVEILKGPASLMYGSDAMAGVINILTNVPVSQGTLKGSVISNYQTNNRLRGVGANLAGNSLSGFNWNVYGSYKAAADYENKYDGRVYNSKFREMNFGGYLGVNRSWGYSHLIFSKFNQKLGLIEGTRDSDGFFVKPVAGGGEETVTSSDNNGTLPGIPWQHIQHTKLVSDNSFNVGNGRLTAVLGYQRNQRMEYGNIDDPSERELYFDLNTGTYNFAYHFRESNGWRNSIGLNGMVQSNQNKGAEVLIPEYSLFDIGGFWYSQKNWKKLSLSGGIRFDNRSLSSKEFREGTDVKFSAFDKDFANVSGSIGLSYEVSNDLTLKFNVARGFRSPAIAELASNGAHEGTNRYEYGDQQLKSETSLQVDGGMEWNSEHLSVSASLFYNNISNFIFYRKLSNAGGTDSLVEVDGDFLMAFQFDQRRATLSGAEISLDIHPHPLDWLHFENSFSFVRARFSEALEGSRNIPFVPAARLLSDLRGDFFKKGKLFRNVFLMLEMDATFKQSHPFTGYNTETETPSYTLFNIGTGTDIVSKGKTLFSLYLTAINVGDVAYQNHLSRLKYTDINQATGRMGVFNMGRNFSIKLNVPINGRLGKSS